MESKKHSISKENININDGVSRQKIYIPKIILTSHGLNCKEGRQAINRAFMEAYGTDYRGIFKEKTIVMFTLKTYGINELLRHQITNYGFVSDNVVIWDETVDEVIKHSDKCYDFCYCSEGNVFALMQMLHDTGAVNVIKRSLAVQGSYIGSSAGGVIACTSIKYALDFDKNYVCLTDFKGLDILPKHLGRVAIIPHYTRQQFMRWKRNTPDHEVNEYDNILYVSNTQYRLFDSDYSNSF